MQMQLGSRDRSLRDEGAAERSVFCGLLIAMIDQARRDSRKATKLGAAARQSGPSYTSCLQGQVASTVTFSWKWLTFRLDQFWGADHGLIPGGRSTGSTIYRSFSFA